MVRILVVDDKPEVSEPIAEGLELCLGGGVAVDIAADGQMALDMFRERHHKGIISDGNVLRMTGP